MSDRLVRGLVVLLCLASLAAGFAATRHSERLVGQAVPGFFIFATGFLGPSILFLDRDAAEASGAGMFDRVVAVDGVPFTSGRATRDAAAHAGAGHVQRLVMERPWGRRFEARVTVRVFRPDDQLRLLAICWAPTLLLLALGAAVALWRPRLESARVLFAFAWAFSTSFGFLGIDSLLTQAFVPWSNVIAALGISAFGHLALLLPERGRLMERHPLAVPAVLHGAALLFYAVYLVRYLEAPSSGYPLDVSAFAGYAVATLALAGNLLRTALRSSDVHGRQRARVMLLAPLGGALAGLASRSALGLSWTEACGIAFLFTAASLPVPIAVAIVRRNLFELDAWAQRAISTGTVAAACTIAYALLFLGLRQVFEPRAPGADALVSLACLLAVLPAVGPLRRSTERGVRALLFPGQHDASLALRELTATLAHVRGLEELGSLVAAAARRGTGGAWAEVVVAPETRPAERFRSGEAETGQQPAGGGLSVPVPASGEGSIRLETGPRSDGRPYTTTEADWLNTLALRCAVAFENSRAWEQVRALQERVARENELLREEVALESDFTDFIGRSPEVQRVLAQVEQVAAVDVVVLVVGETGTGKELIAHALHRLSPRRDGPLVKFACAAVPESLFESELFGHEKGAFTGAVGSRVGRFEAADGGTLFLDDVDTLPLDAQAKLLRAIQEGEVQRLGSEKPRQVDVRLVAATNRDLLAEVRAGRFREDLYYRLHVVPVQLPALRERGDDALLLAEHFAERSARQLGREPLPLSARSRERIRSYRWPGNVRELRNAVERAAVLSTGDELELVVDDSAPVAAPAPEIDDSAARALAETVRELKVQLIERALSQTAGNQRKAAALLGLHPQSLSRTMRTLGLRAGTSVNE